MNSDWAQRTPETGFNVFFQQNKRPTILQSRQIFPKLAKKKGKG
jgi:hypothetical protein